MPHSVAARADELYFCVKRAVLDENRYASDLWVLRDGKAKRLTSAGDVSGFWLTDEGVVFSALREKRDKERAEAGEPLTVLYVLPYDGGEARELCRLDCSVGEVRFLGGGRFLFTATVSRDWERALSEAGGDAKKAAEALKKERAACTVVDELPFWFNGRGFVNGNRSRLGIWEDGAYRFLTGENTDAELGGLSPDGRLAELHRCGLDRHHAAQRPALPPRHRNAGHRGHHRGRGRLALLVRAPRGRAHRRAGEHPRQVRPQPEPLALPA